MNYKHAANLLVGDRELPLEADLQSDVVYSHPLVGKKVEVSVVANGSFEGLQGSSAIVTGVVLRFGIPVALRVMVEGKKVTGTLKDFYISRDVLEDVQPPTATSVGVKECLKHYTQQRDYWLPLIDGIEAFCFELSSVAPACEIINHPAGFAVLVPEPQTRDVTMVVVTVAVHNNYYSMSAMVYPYRSNKSFQPRTFSTDHWIRTYIYAAKICKILINKGVGWGSQLKYLLERKAFTVNVLQPLLEKTLPKVLKATEEITGKEKVNVYFDGVSIGLSKVRLKPATVGLNEPPTDRRPYTVISIDPSSLENDNPDYLSQVVLHECIHLCVANVKSKEPHNGLFMQLAEKVGLEKRYRN